MDVIARESRQSPIRTPSDSPAFTATQASVFLDLVRALAALLVLVSHWRNFLFQDYPQLPTHTPAVSLFYLLTAGGHQAVIVFFVLSGYLIGGSIFRSLRRDAWSWRNYLLQRLTRLWVVLIPGLLLCLFWDRLGLHLHLAPVLYSGASLNHMTGDVDTLDAPRIFLQNVLFLQGLSAPMFGSDGALWSLANEFWYYLLFPLGLHALRPSTPLRTRLTCAALFLVAAWVARNSLVGFPIWLSGAVLALLPTPKLGPSARLAAVFIYIPILYLLPKATLPVFFVDFLLTAASFALLSILLSATKPSRPTLGERTTRTLARFSYTLYVVHMPFLLFVAALVAHDTRWHPDLLHFAEALAILFLTLAYAYAVAALTEFHTDTARKWLERKLGLRS